MKTRSFLIPVLLAISILSITLMAPPVQAGKGDLIVEILERILKKSDETAPATKGGAQGAAPEVARQTMIEEAAKSDDPFWGECVVAAEQQRVNQARLEIESLRLKALSNEDLKVAASQLDADLDRKFCYEMIKCKAAVISEYSTMAEDFTSCIAEEPSEIAELY